MGQKINPIGLRLGIHRKWNSNWYFDSINYSKFLHINFEIDKFFTDILTYYPIKTLVLNCQLIKLPSNQLYIFLFIYKLKQKKKRSKKQRFFNTINYNTKSSFDLFEKNYKLFVNKQLEKNNNQKSFIPFTKLVKNQNSKEIINIKDFSSIIKKEQFHFIRDLANIKKDLKILKKYNNNNYYHKLIYKLKLNILNIKYTKLIILYNVLILLNKKNSNDNFINEYKLKLAFKKIDKINLCLKKIKNRFFIWQNMKHICKSNKKIFLLTYIHMNQLLNKKNTTLNEFINSKKYYKKNIIEKKKKKKIIFYKKNKYNFIEIKKFLTKITNLKTSIIIINSWSFLRFYYSIEKDKAYLKKTPEILSSIQQQIVNKFRYNAIYVEDFVKLAFISLVLKKPQILTNFIAFQITSLPKNKRQLKLIQLVTKTLEALIRERTEILGLKISFKGRINKRKRARTLSFKRGIVPLQTITSRIEYGYSNAYTKNGSLGIKFWIYYKKSFKKEFKTNFLQYINYTKLKKNHVIKTK